MKCPQKKMLMKARIQAKLEKLNNQKDYSRKRLENCKSWRGPCVLAEVQAIHLPNADIQGRIVKVELGNFRQIHEPDMIAGPDLFKLNKMSNEEQLENLMILLSDRDNLNGTVVDLPTNADFLQMITSDASQTKETRNNVTASDQ